MRPSAFERAVVAVIRGIPPGTVVSYGEVADEAGFPGAARAVGALLRSSPDDLPWWRVVRADGTIATTPPGRQAALLAEEGVTVSWEGASPRVEARPAGAGTRRPVPPPPY